MHLRSPACFVIALFAFRAPQAIMPGHMNDAELADCPVIVIAQWNKAPIKEHNKIVRNVALESESYTKIRILRTVKGPAIEPGEHEILVNYGITWNKDGSFVNSGTSTEMSGDVEDITLPRLWFFHQEKSWDKKRNKRYLTIDHHRMIQPLELESFYLALASKQPDQQVMRLLDPERPRIAMRSLHYMAREDWPWPYDYEDSYEENRAEEQESKRLPKDAVPRVWDLMQSKDADLRSYALCIYAKWSGKSGIQKLRTLLKDPDSEIRGIAAGTLIRHRDEASIPQVVNALKGIESGELGCRLVQEIGRWENAHLIPGLINFLQNDHFSAFHEDMALDVPAHKAREVLHRMTGHWFPFDVEQAQQAWTQVAAIKDPAERRATLVKFLPGMECPLRASIAGNQGAKATIRITNISTNPVDLLRSTDTLEMRWPGRTSTMGTDFYRDDPLRKQDFIRLKPGHHHHFKVRLDKDWLAADEDDQHLKLYYGKNGHEFGLHAWIGILEVGAGAH